MKIQRVSRGAPTLADAATPRAMTAMGSTVQAGFLGTVEVQEEEASGVPDLVGEGAVALGAALAEGDVGAGRGLAGEGEAHGVGAVLGDNLDGIDDVALGLGHLLPLGIADERVDVDLTERDRVFKEKYAAAIRRCRRASAHRA